MNLPKNRSMLALLLAFVLLGFTPLHWNAPVSVASIVSSNRRTPDSPTLSPISSIGGVMRDVQVVGNLAYIGEGPSLAIVDVSDPAAPVVVSRTYVAAETRSVVVVDDRAYVAANTAGLYIFDVSDPSTPRQIGHWDQRTHAVVVSGDLAYVTDLLNLTILDVADPGDLQVAGSYAIPAERGYTGELAISGQYVYLTFTTYDADFTNWLGSLYIVDVATPASPALLGSYTLPTNSTADDVQVVGTVAYLASAEYSATDGLYTLDVSDPSNPTQLARYDASVYRIQVAGNTAYLSGDQMLVVDVADPNNLLAISSFELSSTGLALSVVDDIVYIADPRGGMRVINVATPSTPIEEGMYQSLTRAHDVVVSGGIAYVAGRWSGDLRLVDVSIPGQPRLIGHLPMDGDPYRLQVAGNRAYIADAEGRAFWIIDVSDPANPAVLAEVQKSTYVDDITVTGATAYLANSADGLRVYDISDPASAREVGFYDEENVGIQGVSVVDTTVYAVGNSIINNMLVGLLITFDASDPANPQKLASLELNLPQNHQTWRVTVVDGTAYIGAGNMSEAGSMRIVDVSDPADPALRGLYETPSHIEDIDVVDNKAFLATNSYGGMATGLKVVDVSDPAAPVEVASFAQDGTGVFVADGTVYLAGDSLTLVKYQEEATRIYLPALSR